MEIARLDAVPATFAHNANGARANDVAGQFDTVFYRLLLQTVNWTSGISGGNKAEQAVFGGMLTDFFAQEAARQQSGFGAMLLNTIDEQGKGRP